MRTEVGMGELIDLRNKVTVREAAKLTGRHAETVKRWIREESIPAQMVGQMWYIDRSDLQDKVAK